MSLPDLDETTWLGAAIVGAQRVEFVLYGIVSHLSHIPEAQKERRFRELTPEKFIRGDVEELKATLGQLIKLFGDTLLIATPELVTFYEDRNLIAHNYYREFHTEFRGRPKREGGEAFLKEFATRAESWFDVLNGLLHEMVIAAAKQGRGPAFVSTPKKEAQRLAYLEHAGRYLASRQEGARPLSEVG